MSHKATNWAFEQVGLRPGEKFVLVTLADCHNPVHGCFPAQDYIAAACGISRRSVNTHLAALERHGLIRREERINAKGQQESTRYHLRFEDSFSAFAPVDKPVDNGENRVQDLHTARVQIDAENRVQNLHTNLVIENRNHTPAHTRESGPVDNRVWEGDPELRRRIVADKRYGPTFAASYLDPATPGDDRKIYAATRTAADRLIGCHVVQAMAFRVKPP